MLNEDQTDNSDKAVFAALVAGGFVWIVFGSFPLGLIAACVAFVIINRTPENKDHSEG